MHAPYKPKYVKHYKRLWQSVKGPASLAEYQGLRLPVSYLIMKLLAKHDTSMGLEMRLLSGIRMHLLLSQIIIPKEMANRVHLHQSSLEEIRLVILQVNRTRMVQISQRMDAMENTVFIGNENSPNRNLIVIKWNQASRAVLLNRMGEIMRQRFLLSFEINLYKCSGNRHVLITFSSVSLRQLGIGTTFPSLWDGDLTSCKIKYV